MSLREIQAMESTQVKSNDNKKAPVKERKPRQEAKPNPSPVPAFSIIQAQQASHGPPQPVKSTGGGVWAKFAASKPTSFRAIQGNEQRGGREKAAPRTPTKEEESFWDYDEAEEETQQKQQPKNDFPSLSSTKRGKNRRRKRGE